MCVVLQLVGVEIVIVEESREYCMDVRGLTACWCGDSDGRGWGEGSTVLTLQLVGMETMTVGE